MRVLEIVLPVFGVLGLGLLCARTGAIDEAGNRGLHRFTFFVALPCMLIDKLARVELPPAPPWNYLLAYYLGAFAVFLLGALASRFVFRRGVPAQAMAGFGSSYSNTVMLGIPLVLSAFGDAAAVPLFLMLALHSPLLFSLTTVVVEIGRGHPHEARRAPLRALREVATNNLILSIAAGIALNLLDIDLPVAVGSLLGTVGAAAPACALFTLGVALSRYRLMGEMGEALAIVVTKNLLQPAVTAALAVYVFRLDPLWARTAILIAAMPTGINVYMFAHQYAVAEAAMTRTVVLSTLASLATLPVLLAFLLRT
jgi:hypothetical protein